MDMTEALKKVEELKIVPVVAINDAKDAKPLAKALCNGGLPVAEVTFRTAAAADSIKAMLEEYPDMFVGAGTVLNVEQCKKALEAGAKFIVTPGYPEEVVAYCCENNVPVFPGIATPSELMRVVAHDLPVAKFFPAEQYGGLKTINAMSGPFPQMRFMPSGGINENNVLEYLANKKIVGVGGSWMCKTPLIDAGKFDEIEAMTRSAVELVKNA